MERSLGEIAESLDLTLIGDPEIRITGLASLPDALPGQLSFLFNTAYRKQLLETGASAVVLKEEDAAVAPCAVLISPQPRLTWAKIAGLFDPVPMPERVIHEDATVADQVKIGADVSIGPRAVVEKGAVIEQDCIIGAGCYVGQNVHIGKGSRLYANVSIHHDVVIGQRAIIHSGAVLGADGFGFEFDGSRGVLEKIPQIYAVVLGDDVEIGAGTTIDRGALNHTSLGNGVKLDNQVQVGHGTRIGDHTVISGCTAIAGSTKIGSYCLIGGAVGIIDNLEIADQVEITAMTLVSHSITEKGRYSSGTGLLPSRIWKRSIVGFSKLDEILKRLRRLETRD